MKYIILVIVLGTLVCCKKKKSSVADPVPIPIPVCQPVSMYLGTYRKSATEKYITISLISNGCPIKGDSNNYLVTGLKEAMVGFITDPKYVLTANEYTMRSRGDEFKIIDNIDKTHKFSFAPADANNAECCIKFFASMPTAGPSTVFFVRTN